MVNSRETDQRGSNTIRTQAQWSFFEGGFKSNMMVGVVRYRPISFSKKGQTHTIDCNQNTAQTQTMGRNSEGEQTAIPRRWLRLSSSLAM